MADEPVKTPAPVVEPVADETVQVNEAADEVVAAPEEPVVEGDVQEGADEKVEEAGGTAEEGGEEGTEDAAEEGDAAAPAEAEKTTHKGKDDWTAVWSAEANAYYFWNAKSNETTWENPLLAPAASTSTLPTPAPATDPSGRAIISYDGIDPELAYLDPSYSRANSSAAPSFQARFNSRTGRFQGDPTMNPDRISEFSRGERQQNAFYDTASWQTSLEGKGLKRSGEEAEGGTRKKKPTAKEVVSADFESLGGDRVLIWSHRTGSVQGEQRDEEEGQARSLAGVRWSTVLDCASM
jgi:hypothetical protein